MNRWTFVVLPLAILGCPADPPPIDDNAVPVARLVLPQLVLAGAVIDVDASGSDDEDGDALAFVYGFGDGTPEVESGEGVFAHAWAEPGTFTVTVRVIDERAFEAEVSLPLVVALGEDEGCSCDLACFDDAVCTARGCLVVASSADEEAAAFDDAIACP